MKVDCDFIYNDNGNFVKGWTYLSAQTKEIELQ